MHPQSDVAQETPFHFPRRPRWKPTSAARTAAGRSGSLLLVNHWVDTSPAPRPTIAREVNQAAVLETRLARCRTRNRPFPTILAIDFYRQGDVVQGGRTGHPERVIKPHPLRPWRHADDQCGAEPAVKPTFMAPKVAV